MLEHRLQLVESAEPTDTDGELRNLNIQDFGKGVRSGGLGTNAPQRILKDDHIWKFVRKKKCSVLDLSKVKSWK